MPSLSLYFWSVGGYYLIGFLGVSYLNPPTRSAYIYMYINIINKYIYIYIVYIYNIYIYVESHNVLYNIYIYGINMRMGQIEGQTPDLGLVWTISNSGGIQF